MMPGTQASHCVHLVHLTSRGDCQEILAPWKNKHPRKCNRFWARKVIENFKYSDHFSSIEYARNSLYTLNISILEYMWNSLNIPGIFPQYSAFEYFLLFTVEYLPYIYIRHFLLNLLRKHLAFNSCRHVESPVLEKSCPVLK